MESRRRAREGTNPTQNTQQQPDSAYINLDFIVGTSVVVENLFRQGKLVLSDIRQGMSPLLFECYMFLYYNSDLWDETDISHMLKRQTTSIREQEEERLSGNLD